MGESVSIFVLRGIRPCTRICLDLNVHGKIIGHFPVVFNSAPFYQRFVFDHYLKQFKEETIRNKQQKTCGEPSAAVCKKMNGSFKKDYEPYQAMGLLCGIFDQRAAEKLAGHADMQGFDAIAADGILAWLIDCLDEKLLDPGHISVEMKPKWDFQDFPMAEKDLRGAMNSLKIV